MRNVETSQPPTFTADAPTLAPVSPVRSEPTSPRALPPAPGGLTSLGSRRTTESSGGLQPQRPRQSAPPDPTGESLVRASPPAGELSALRLREIELQPASPQREVLGPPQPEIQAPRNLSSSSSSAPPDELREVGGAAAAERRAALARLETAVRAASTRRVDPAEAAGLVNRLRRIGPGPMAPGVTRAATHADLMQGITEADVTQWYRAQGVSAQEVEALRWSAFKSGIANPTGTFVNNALQFILSPWVGHITKQPWASAGLGIGVAALGAPMNSAQQSAVVTLCESIREHGGPVIVPDKNNINDKHYLPELSNDLQHHVRQFSDLHDRLAQTIERLGLSAAELPEQGLRAALQQLHGGELQRLRQQGQELLNEEAQLHLTQRDFMMTQGAHERQWMGNRYQAIPRTLRSPVAGFASLAAKADQRWISPTVQTVASLVLTAAQHLAAGFDEQSKQDYNNKLNLLYGDFVNAAGKEKITRGEPLQAGDIDEAKLRSFVQFPAQSVVKHVAAEMRRQIADIGQLVRAARGPHAERDRDALAALQADAATLRAGRLSQLRPGGLAESLLAASENSVLSKQLLNDIAAKYTYQEFSAQTAQRIGQMFHMVVLGSAASSIMGKMASAASGGAGESSYMQTAIVSSVSGAMAAIGATNQHTAISVKNNRREGDVDIGLLNQVTRGVAGGLAEGLAQRKGTRASREGSAMLDQQRVEETLQFARAMTQQLGTMPLPETTPAPLTLAQAGRTLNPGFEMPTGTGHVAVDVGRSSGEPR